MIFKNLFWITGRGWVADVTLTPNEVYRAGDLVTIGNIKWEIMGVEMQRDSSHAPTGVGLQLKPKAICFAERSNLMPSEGIPIDEERQARLAEEAPMAMERTDIGHAVREARDIGFAVRLLKRGHRVTRRGWNGQGQWLALREPLSSQDDVKLQHTAMTLPYVFIRTVQGDYVPWLCSQTDLIAEDWEIV